MFWNAGGFGYVIVLITLGLKNWIWLVCDREYPKSFWSWKKLKTYFFIQSWFCPFFCEKVNFLTAPAQSCRRCSQFDIGCTLRTGLHEIPALIRTCPHGLENIHASKWISDKFHGMLTYILFLENGQKFICMHVWSLIHMERSFFFSKVCDRFVPLISYY